MKKFILFLLFLLVPALSISQPIRPFTSIKWLDYTPSSVTLTAGTLNSGNVASVQDMFDGDVYYIEELAATPGFDFSFTFTGIQPNKKPSSIVCRWIYNGSATHNVTIDLYNYTTTAWDQVRRFGDTDGYYSSMYMLIPIIDRGNYVNASGEAQIRFYHQNGGNESHDIRVDYVGLTYTPNFEL